MLNSNENHLYFPFLYIMQIIFILSPSYFSFTFQDCYSLLFFSNWKTVYINVFFIDIFLYIVPFIFVLLFMNTGALSFLSQYLKSLLGLALLFDADVCNSNQEC